MNKKVLARNLRVFMGLKNIWVPEMSSLTGISIYNLNMYSRDDSGRLPTSEELAKIAHVLKIKVGALLDENAVTFNYDKE